MTGVHWLDLLIYRTLYRPLTVLKAFSVNSIDHCGPGRLSENANVAFMGDTKGGPFDVAGDRSGARVAPFAGEPERPDQRGTS